MAGELTIRGMEQLQARIKNSPTNIQKIVSAELKFGAQGIAAEAKQRAPGNEGILRNLISVETIDPLNYTVTSGAEYSAYVEFGTGTYVEVPEGLEEFAIQFKGDGSSNGNLSAKEAIFEWCRLKGIDQSAWYPIYISIMKNGVHAQPFFFPAFARQEPLIMANIKRALETAI